MVAGQRTRANGFEGSTRQGYLVPAPKNIKTRRAFTRGHEYTEHCTRSQNYHCIGSTDNIVGSVAQGVSDFADSTTYKFKNRNFVLTRNFFDAFVLSRLRHSPLGMIDRGTYQSAGKRD